MRIALATGLLPVPPTYFALQHGERLQAENEVRMFALAADIRDAAVSVDVDAVLPSIGPWSARMGAAFATAALSSAVQARRIAGFEPDVVHQHFATWSRGALDGAARAGAPIVATLHGYDVFAAEGTGRSPLERFHRRSVADTAARADRLLAVSRYLADRAIAAGFPTQRLEVHYQGVDTEVFTPGDGPGAEPSLVFIGALARRKGIDDLIDASIASAERAPHRLRIIGAGPLESRVRSAALAHPHIDALGSISRPEVLSELRAARALVLPTQESAGRREAAGLVLLEAQACGVPVIAYRSGGTPEMVDDGTTGLLVDEFDRDGLSAAMERILLAPDGEWAQMSAAARSFVVASRSLEVSVRALLDHYRDLRRPAAP